MSEELAPVVKPRTDHPLVIGFIVLLACVAAAALSLVAERDAHANRERQQVEALRRREEEQARIERIVAAIFQELDRRNLKVHECHAR